MASRHRVTCTKKDGADADRRIDGIGGSSGGTGANGAWYLQIDKAIAGIEDGTWAFYVVVERREVDVVVRTHQTSGRKYLTTEGDGFPPNNLLNLPNCP